MSNAAEIDPSRISLEEMFSPPGILPTPASDNGHGNEIRERKTQTGATTAASPLPKPNARILGTMKRNRRTAERMISVLPPAYCYLQV